MSGIVCEFSSASTLSVHTSMYLYTLLGVCVHTGGESRGAGEEKGEENGRQREREKRNGAGDNNHNNLVKRYKDISR